LEHTPGSAQGNEEEDVFEEWLYRRKEDGAAIDGFLGYSRAGSAIPATERFDSYSLVEPAKYRRILSCPTTLVLRYILLSSNIR
jgi:hypothetical protein